MDEVLDGRIVSYAAALLQNRFGVGEAHFSLREPEVLSGSGAAVVVRAKVNQSPVFPHRSIIIKYVPETGDPFDDAALLREIVAYQFTNSMAEDARPGPVLLAYDIKTRILIITDSGEGLTFADLLASNDEERRLHVIRNLGHALGRMHASTASKEAQFNILLRRVIDANPDHAEVLIARDQVLLTSITGGLRVIENSDIVLPHAARDLAADAQRRLSSGQHRAFTPFDLSPDNIIFSERTQFLDYEWAGFRDVTFDVACVIAGFPQFLTTSQLSSKETDEFIHCWAEEIKKAWPNVMNEERRNARILTALVGWALSSVSTLYYGSLARLGDSEELDSRDLSALRSKGNPIRMDLLETFSALQRFATDKNPGNDPRFEEIASFAAEVCERLG
ncbi:MAG: phosphotransferase [Corynebacterium sp.]|nr:phosphotransferase [Corynebacterium sp.]